MIARLVRDSSLGSICLATLMYFPSAYGEIAPRNGTFDGAYHRDRWGVGRFEYFLVSPALHDRLKGFENRRIRLEALDIHQPFNPGSAIIRTIGKVIPLEESPVELEIRTDFGTIANQLELDLTCFLTNRSAQPLDITLKNVIIQIYSPSGNQQNVPDFFFEQYTRGQLETTARLTQFLNNHLNVAAGSFEDGHHLKIAPHQRMAVVARIPITSGDHELQIRVKPGLGPSSLPTRVTWFPITAKLDEQRKPRLENLTLEKVSWATATNSWGRPTRRLSFILKKSDAQKRSVIACSKSQRWLLAGTITGSSDGRSFSKLEVEPCYDCSNQGEPWELREIPEDGIATWIDVADRRDGNQQTNLRKIRLELLTDDGLESFSLDGLLPDAAGGIPERQK